jgi:3-deoxy-manno-octulosonate cytidylyltransferase (CMP-KDO synthetase)
MRVLGVIPARLGSTRLPHKPLQPLAGEPLVTRVVERVLEHEVVTELVVATDSTLVVDAVKRSRVQAVLTGSHQTGTDRVAEVAERSEFRRFDVVLNIQGDEPFVSREALIGALERVEQGDDIGTVAAPLDPALALDPNRVKVVTDARGRALYFSRAAIPYQQGAASTDNGRQDLYRQHVGVYAYSRNALGRWVSLPPCPPGEAERLEQLRALYHGLAVGVAGLAGPVFPGIDTAEDLRRAEVHWHAYQGQV